MIEKSSVFSDMTPCSLIVPTYQHEAGTELVVAFFVLVYYLAYFETLRMEAIYAAEASVGSQHTAWSYNPENVTHRNVIVYVSSSPDNYHHIRDDFYSKANIQSDHI
jgi:hypothetical protein